MESDSRSLVGGEGTLEELMRERIRATIEAIVDEELKGALGAAPSQRVGSVRAGYRHGKRPRTLRMLCGWGCGGWLTEHEMRAHFTKCPNRPAA